MKKIYSLIIAACSFLLTSCGLLEVKSEDKLPGDEFWIDGNAANVEGFRIELRHRSVGGTDQWCRKHDVYDINCIQYGFR